jgi:hypothetical protein
MADRWCSALTHGLHLRPGSESPDGASVVTISFRPTAEDLRLIEANRRPGEDANDVIRRALRLLDLKALQEHDRTVNPRR